jgi:chromate transporter
VAFDLPVAGSVNLAAVILTAAAAVAIFRFRIGTLWTLAGAAAAGLGWWLATGQL